jgi:hypothetical protein
LYRIKDSRELLPELLKHKEEKVIEVEVDLPDFIDVTSMLALGRRLKESAEIAGVELRLIGSTANPLVDKLFTKQFVDCVNIYTQVKWRGVDE